MSTEIIEEKAKETVTIGDKVYSIDDISPTTYFNYVKDMRKNIEDENLQTVADNCLELLKKTKITGQTKIAEKIFNEYSLIIRELKAASFGFDTIVYKSDIEKFITKISNHPVKLIELKNYPREVADDVLDKLMLAKDNELFDEYYIVFTDYTGEETKKIAKERRDKDPILFGAFKTPDNNNIPEERFFYIGDWIDEYCDLTLEEMLTKYESSENVGAKYNISIPKDVDELKEYMGLIEKKNPEKATLISKIKKAATRRRRTTKKKEDK